MPTLAKPIPPLSEKSDALFLKKINFNGPLMPGQTECCHLWTGGMFSDGYGAFGASGRTMKAHRVAFARKGGVFTPERPQANHKCGRRDCVNADHIYAGSTLENMADMVRAGMSVRGDKHWSRRNPEMRPRGDTHGSRTKPECVLRGERSGRCKLSDAQVAYVRAAPFVARTLADELGVSISLIRQIRRGVARKHLTPISP